MGAWLSRVKRVKVLLRTLKVLKDPPKVKLKFSLSL